MPQLNFAQLLYTREQLPRIKLANLLSVAFCSVQWKHSFLSTLNRLQRQQWQRDVREHKNGNGQTALLRDTIRRNHERNRTRSTKRNRFKFSDARHVPTAASVACMDGLLWSSGAVTQKEKLPQTRSWKAARGNSSVTGYAQGGWNEWRVGGQCRAGSYADRWMTGKWCLDRRTATFSKTTCCVRPRAGSPTATLFTPEDSFRWSWTTTDNYNMSTASGRMRRVRLDLNPFQYSAH